MAGRRQGGAQHFTVQEAQNSTLGQVGSMFNDGTAAMVAPTDHVFIAITFLTDTTFDSSGGLIAVDSDRFINTEAIATPLSGSSGGTAIDDGNTFSAGITIYGRWTEIDPASGSLIAYIGK
tara:strand:+ start:439 stop:801 length:363 start_codon:yes stop_codon:yes gene_type:complete